MTWKLVVSVMILSQLLEKHTHTHTNTSLMSIFSGNLTLVSCFRERQLV